MYLLRQRFSIRKILRRKKISNQLLTERLNRLEKMDTTTVLQVREIEHVQDIILLGLNHCTQQHFSFHLPISLVVTMLIDFPES